MITPIAQRSAGASRVDDPNHRSGDRQYGVVFFFSGDLALRAMRATEITDPHSAIAVNEHVLHGQISMEDQVAMHVANASGELLSNGNGTFRAKRCLELEERVH